MTNRSSNDVPRLQGWPKRLIPAVIVVAALSILIFLPLAKPAVPINLTPEDQILVARQNAFGFALFRDLIKDGGNVFISPTSIALALSISYNGAQGETKTAMAQTLMISNMTVEQVNNASKNIITFLNYPDKDVELLTANSIWARKGVAFNEEFLRTVQECFDARAGVLDGGDQAVETINRWVDRETRKMIPKIIDQLDPQQVMFLVNAIYFKGAWNKPFDQELTRDEEFTLDHGSKKICPMMRMSKAKDFPYLETPDFEAIELPYGESARLGMYLFLPKEMDAFLANLSMDGWNGWMDQFQELTGTIVMPRFRVEFSKRLNQALESLGMGIAFDPEAANFGGMSDVQTWIDFVDHKAVVEVNEKGTEAAGATIVVHTLSAGPKAQFQMRVDRPFFFVIRDNQSGAILFMGLIKDPQI